MSAAFRRLGQSELLPRYIFIESLIARRRVLEVGAVASTGGESARFLLSRGARAVVACDDDAAQVEAAQQRYGSDQLRFRVSVFEDLEPAGFDLVLVADLAPFVTNPFLMGELARRVARGGHLIGALRNPAGLALSQVLEPEPADPPPTYGQALDALSPHFPSIEVATQSPVLGYQLAFDRADGLQVDGTLAGQSEAAWFVLFAGAVPVRDFEPTWVQLPPEPLAFTSGKVQEAHQRTRSWEERSHRYREALNKARSELQAKEAQLVGVTAALEEKREEVARLLAQLETARAGFGDARQRDELALKLRRMEGELELTRERALDAERRIAEQRAAVERAEAALKDAVSQALRLEEVARNERAQREEHRALLEESRARADALQAELARAVEDGANLRVEFERAQRAAAAEAERAAALEQALAEARERELRLAEQRSAAGDALESLGAELARTRAQVEAAQEQVALKEAERLAAVRSAEVHAQAARDAQAALGEERARLGQVASQAQTLELELRTELEALRAELARTEADRDEAVRAAQTQHALAETLEEKYANAQRELEELSGRVVELDVQLEAARARAMRFERDLTTTVAAERSSRGQLEVSLAEAQAKVRELLDDREALLTRIREQEAVAQDLLRAREATSAELERLTEQVQILTAARGATDAELRERDEALAALEARLEAAQLEAAETERARVDAQAELEAVRKKLEARIQALEQAESALEADLVAARAEAESLRIELDRRSDAEAELRRTLEGAKAEVAQLQAQHAVIQAELTAAQSDVEELRASEAGLLAEVATAREQLQEHAGAAREAEALRVELEAAREEAAHLRTELDAQKAQAVEAGEELGELRELMARHQSLEASLKAELDEARTLAEMARAESESLRQELATLSAARAQSDAGRAALEARIRELEASAKSRAQALEAELSNARAELERHRADAEAAQAAARAREDELSRARDALEQERLSLADQVASLKAAAEAAEAELGKLRGLPREVADRDKRIELLQRRLTAQETELSALRRAMGRHSPPQVQQIYERAAAELDAVKAELLQRSAGGGVGTAARARTAPPASTQPAEPTATEKSAPVPPQPRREAPALPLSDEAEVSAEVETLALDEADVEEIAVDWPADGSRK